MTLDVTERTSAHGLEAHIRGKRIAASDVLADRDILVQIFNREREEGNFIVPAVAEPLLVWIISGNAAVQERELGGQWETSEVAKGDFFLTTSAQPYEMRWNVSSADAFEVMHIYLGVPLLEKAIHEVMGGPVEAVRLREVSGGRDEGLSVLLEHVRLELMGRGASPLYLQGLAQCIAVYLARNYLDSSADDRPRRNALPAYKFRRVLAAMEADLARDFNLRQLAEVAGMSECHFSRMFKKAAGYSPLQFFIRLRMARARQLLLETDQSIIDIGLEVGYSSHSHFSQVFKREVGVTPTQYRQ
ncbi:AraC family transcriptional regulator [Pseudomonas putida SJTE-1]|jgi:AraC family transcriptional regulator|uniref:Helix-turn-helix transcriptional regulator n=3 Tax=Pseudomonas TaxID=286 RepID=A0A7L9G9G0_9PSED|nr:MULTISPECIES: AraC family transcriptional regulator [Pseudomonas]AFK67742.1 helix-turn-helix domain-containing protein [Pseudomonas putida ND6]ANI04700.1 AraC family transcriptional regulator [Pseudomonas putida SJTE-1]MBX6692004.1 helix-turn-helix transcriptional regulator [Pseudomonas sp. USTB-Z]MDD2000793.1 AraC family transcriptional regulator [Pseudomonas putida]MEB3439860.1 AraC family transcriptional regulator [Pseudomonas sp. A2]